MLQVAGFLDHSTVNGEGFRSVLFLSGCYHHCPGCHNEAMQAFDYGETVEVEIIIEKIKKNLPLIDGITLSGGDPFEQIDGLLVLLLALQPLNLSIWAYTGYTYEQLQQDPIRSKLLPFIDVLVDGKFIATLKTDQIAYVGSSNQHIIQLKKKQVIPQVKL